MQNRRLVLTVGLSASNVPMLALALAILGFAEEFAGDLRQRGYEARALGPVAPPSLF